MESNLPAAHYKCGYRIVLFDYVFEPDKPGRSGLSDLVWNWAKHLHEQGDEVHIVAPYSPLTDPPTGIVLHRMTIPRWLYRNVLGHIILILLGWRTIRRIDDIDYIQAPEYLSTALFNLLQPHAPVILVVPGNIYERIQNGNPFDWSMTTVLKLAAAIAARRNTRIIATTPIMYDWWLRSGTPLQRLYLLPHGVDTEHFQPHPQPREHLGLPAHQKIVLYVGRLSPEKGLDTLISAFAYVSAHVPSAHLYLIGTGPAHNQIQQQAQQLGLAERISFVGWVDQAMLPLYYSAADVTVLPSLSEGLPRSMLEALACGSPFVGSAITGIVDCVTHEQTGLLVPPADAAALSESLIRLLTDQKFAAQLGHNARASMVTNYSWPIIIRRTREEVYAPAIANRIRIEPPTP